MKERFPICFGDIKTTISKCSKIRNRPIRHALKQFVQPTTSLYATLNFNELYQLVILFLSIQHKNEKSIVQLKNRICTAAQFNFSQILYTNNCLTPNRFYVAVHIIPEIIQHIPDSHDFRILILEELELAMYNPEFMDAVYALNLHIPSNEKLFPVICWLLSLNVDRISIFCSFIKIVPDLELIPLLFFNIYFRESFETSCNLSATVAEELEFGFDAQKFHDLLVDFIQHLDPETRIQIKYNHLAMKKLQIHYISNKTKLSIAISSNTQRVDDINWFFAHLAKYQLLNKHTANIFMDNPDLIYKVDRHHNFRFRLTVNMDLFRKHFYALLLLGFENPVLDLEKLENGSLKKYMSSLEQLRAAGILTGIKSITDEDYPIIFAKKPFETRAKLFSRMNELRLWDKEGKEYLKHLRNPNQFFEDNEHILNKGCKNRKSSLNLKDRLTLKNYLLSCMLIEKMWMFVQVCQSDNSPFAILHKDCLNYLIRVFIYIHRDFLSADILGIVDWKPIFLPHPRHSEALAKSDSVMDPEDPSPRFEQ